MDPCLQTSSIVMSSKPANEPFYYYNVAQLPSIYLQQAYSQFGTLIYDTGYTSNGSGNSVLLTTSDVWTNNTGTNGPLLRSGIWSDIPTSASTHWQPLITWLGVSECFTQLEDKTYYVGMAGDNGAMLKVNGQIIVKQPLSTLPQSNFKYWHVYPISLKTGHNILEFYGYNQFDIAGFGFEVYDNTYNELTGATILGDLNIVYSTISQTGTTFTLCLNNNLTTNLSGYTCVGNDFIFEPCRNRCVKLSATTINTCSATTEIIKGAINEYRNIVSNNIVSIGYGLKSYNGFISNQNSLVFMTNSRALFPEIPLSDVIPSTITHSGVTFLTDYVYITSVESYEPQQVEYDPQNETYIFLTGQTTSQPINFTTDDPGVIQYNTAYCDPEIDLYQDAVAWYTLKGGCAFGAYWGKCPGPIRNINKCGCTVGIVAVDNIDNAIVGVTASSNLFYNLIFTGNRTPTGLVQNAYDQVCANFTVRTFGRVKRYYPDSLTNSSQNIGVGLMTVSSDVFDPTSSWEQIELSDGLTFFDFASTEELDEYLVPGLEVFSVGSGTWAKGEGINKLVVTSVNLSVLGYGQRNQDTSVSPLYQDLFQVVKSATTIPQGYICEIAFNSDDLGSAVVANINGTRKIIGLLIMLSNPVGQICISDGSGYVVRIDKIANLLNISPYSGQSVNISVPEPEIECEIGMNSIACKEINGEDFCQIGMCYPSVPANTIYVQNCSTLCGFPCNFFSQTITLGKYYRMYFDDYIALGGGLYNNACYKAVSATTEMPYINIGTYWAFDYPVLSGPYDTCQECNDPCLYFTINISQSELNQATGNSNTSQNNKVFLQYTDCVTNTIQTKVYTVAGSYTNDVCSKILLNGDPFTYFYSNNVYTSLSSVNGIPSVLNTGVPCP